MPAETATLSPVRSRTTGAMRTSWSMMIGLGPRTASTMQNSLAPRLGGLPRRLEDLLDVKERCCLDRRVELGGLGAEMTVLRAPAGLRREDPFDLDLGTTPGKADLVGEGGQHRHRFIGQRGQRRELSQAERAPLVDQRVAGGAEEGPRGQHRAEPTGDGGGRVSRVDAGRWPTPAAVIGG